MSEVELETVTSGESTKEAQLDADAEAGEAPPVYPTFGRVHEVFLLLVLLFAQLITQAAVAQGLLPLFYIGETFDVPDVETLSWSVAGYSLTVGTFILCAGRLGDIFGHKKMFLLGLGWLVLWSLLAGISNYSTFIFFAVCRGFQGIGPAFLLPNAMAIIGRSYKPGIRQTMIFSLFGACAPSGFALGAVFSSLLTELASWPWTFYLCAIVCTGVIVLCWFVIPADEDSPSRSESFDYIGSLLGVSGLILVNVAWNQGPAVGWDTPYTYILLIIGIALLVGFFVAELFVAFPLLPVSIFNRKTGLALGCIACGWGTFGIWIFYLFIMLLKLRDHSPLIATAEVTPVIVSGFLASGATGMLISRRTPIAIVMGLAMTAFLITSLLLATMPVDQTYWAQTFVSFVVGPFGMDMSFPAATIMFSTSVPRQHQGMAASLVTTVVNYSISIALGVAGTLVAYTTPGQSVEAITTSIHYAAWLAVGLSSLGIILAFVALMFEVYERVQQKEKTSPPPIH